MNYKSLLFPSSPNPSKISFSLSETQLSQSCSCHIPSMSIHFKTSHPLPSKMMNPQTLQPIRPELLSGSSSLAGSQHRLEPTPPANLRHSSILAARWGTLHSIPYDRPFPAGKTLSLPRSRNQTEGICWHHLIWLQANQVAPTIPPLLRLPSPYPSRSLLSALNLVFLWYIQAIDNDFSLFRKQPNLISIVRTGTGNNQ